MNLVLKEHDNYTWELSNSSEIDDIVLLKVMNYFNWDLAAYVMSRYLRRCMQISSTEFMRWKANQSSCSFSKLKYYEKSI